MLTNNYTQTIDPTELSTIIKQLNDFEFSKELATILTQLPKIQELDFVEQNYVEYTNLDFYSLFPIKARHLIYLDFVNNNTKALFMVNDDMYTPIQLLKYIFKNINIGSNGYINQLGQYIDDTVDYR
jgi:hypothetical protein